MLDFNVITNLMTEAEAHTLAHGLYGGNATEIQTNTTSGVVGFVARFNVSSVADENGIRSELDEDDRVTFYRSRGAYADTLCEAMGEDDPAHTI